MMFQRLILLACLPIFCGLNLAWAETATTRELPVPLTQRTETLQLEFRKQLVKAAEGVWVAVGYGAANATLIEGDTGAIIIDTMYGTEAAGHVLAAFREVTDKPVVAIIITHGHADHKGATSVFQDGGTPQISECGFK